MLILLATAFALTGFAAPMAGDAAAVRRGPFALSLEKDTQRLSLSDARTGLTWSSDAPALSLVVGGKELTAGAVTVESARTGVRVRLSDFRDGEQASRASVTFRADLTGEGVRFRLDPVANPAEEDVTAVRFPRRFGRTGDEPRGYLVLPIGLGGVRPFDRGPYRWETRLYANGSHGPNMAFLAKVLSPTVREPGPALLAILHTPFDCGLGIETRDFTPSWSVETRPTLLEGRQRRLQVNYPREVEYRLLPSAGYVECAKAYRRHVIASGRFRSLRDRLREQPDLAMHLGAIIKKQYQGPQFDGGEIARARDLGLKKCVWFVGGWNFGGYDDKYPTRLPPNPKMTGPDGTTGEEGLRRAAALAREHGFVLSVHDNYSDAYTNSPEWDERIISVRPSGERVKGGVWNGGQAWIICLREQVRLARRDLPRVRRILGRGGYFIDVTGAAGTGCCFDPAHPHDARESAALKRELLSVARKEFGVIYTEGLYDFLIPETDGCHKIFIPVGSPSPPYEDAIAVPLFPLIYHDAVICWDLRRANPSRAKDPKAPKYLPLDGYVPLYGAAPTTLDAAGKEIAEAMAGAQLAEMLDHRFLAEGVECTTFADGTRVVANFGESAFDDGGVLVRPRGFRIVKGDPKR